MACNSSFKAEEFYDNIIELFTNDQAWAKETLGWWNE
jgi:hypothetical protein